MLNSTAHRPGLAVSRCLLGHQVRYDGRDKYHYFITEVLAASLPVWPLCPETEAGMGVPRPALCLQQQGAQVRMVTVTDGLDVTERLYQVCRQYQTLFQQIDGLVLKSRSPSCALGDAICRSADVFGRSSAAAPDAGIHNSGAGPGMLLRSGVVPPMLPVIDEILLADPTRRRKFIDAVFEHWRRRHKHLTPEHIGRVAQLAAQLHAAQFIRV